MDNTRDKPRDNTPDPVSAGDAATQRHVLDADVAERVAHLRVRARRRHRVRASSQQRDVSGAGMDKTRDNTREPVSGAADAATQRHVLDADVAERVAHLRVRARHVVEGLRSGLHRSPHRGASVIFAEHREYRPGDDLRLLDWRAYARSDRHSIKRFEQETHLRAHLVLDASASMTYDGGRADTGKAEHAATLLGALGMILLGQGDAAGAHVIDVGLLRSVPPRSRPDHLEAILRMFAEPPRPKARTLLRPALTALAERIGRRALVVIASDLLDFSANALEPLALLKARGHDVRVFHVLHPDELDFDWRERARFEDPEGDGWLDVDPPAIRDAYRGELAKFMDDCKRRCVAAGARYVLARTDQPIREVLVEALGRHRRGAWG